MFICVQPYTVDTCSSLLKEKESIWCWKVRDGSRLSFLALSVRAAQLFALYEPGFSGFFVGQWSQGASSHVHKGVVDVPLSQ